MAHPSSAKALRGFLGLSGFYCKFIHNYTAIAQPLITLLTKDGFKWSPAAHNSFDVLKCALVQALILSLTVIQMDASGFAMGIVLLQKGHPLSYFSRLFCPQVTYAYTYLRELHLITCGVKKCQQYLLCHFFTIQIDHHNLKELLT